MTDYSISNGSTQLVIDEQDADTIKQGNGPVGYRIDVQGGPARLVHREYQSADSEDQAIPLLDGEAISMDPRGREWYVYNDAASGSITVNVTPQYFGVLANDGV